MNEIKRLDNWRLSKPVEATDMETKVQSIFQATIIEQETDVSTLGKRIVVRDSLAAKLKHAEGVNLVVYSSKKSDEHPVWLNGFLYLFLALIGLSSVIRLMIKV